MKTIPRVRLADLPPPPAGRTGWPWTEESPALPARRPDGSDWPRLSIITPSFNQAAYIEEALRSVLLQGYPALEYLVIDGASTDASVGIIRQYEPFLSVFVSESDGGHADALNKGLRQATGSIVAYLDSDDFYLPGAFGAVMQEFQDKEPVDFVYGGCRFVEESGREFIEHFGDISRLEEALDYWQVWRANREIVQPEAFWRKSLSDQAGPFNPRLGSAFFHEYCCRLLMAGAIFRRLDRPLACFRFHPAQRSQREEDRAEQEYLEMAEPWLWDARVPLPAARRRELQGEWLYNRKYCPAWEASVRRGESKWRRWAGTAWLCLRHPQILFSDHFRRRLDPWRRRLGLGRS